MGHYITTPTTDAEKAALAVLLMRGLVRWDAVAHRWADLRR